MDLFKKIEDISAFCSGTYKFETEETYNNEQYKQFFFKALDLIKKHKLNVCGGSALVGDRVIVINKDYTASCWMLPYGSLTKLTKKTNDDSWEEIYLCLEDICDQMIDAINNTISQLQDDQLDQSNIIKDEESFSAIVETPKPNKGLFN